MNDKVLSHGPAWARIPVLYGKLGNQVRTLLDQLERSLGARLYYLSLFAALAIPDIAGALDSADGRADAERYKTWFEEWVEPRFAEAILSPVPPEIRTLVQTPKPLLAGACYRFRCSLLHQGSSQHPQSPYARIIFIEPGATSNVIHNCLVGDALMIDLTSFCAEVIAAARLWLDKVESTDRYRANYEKFAKRYPDGLRPYIAGVPVVG